MNKTLFFVRHCEAKGQEPEAPLTEEGRSHSIKLVGLLRDGKIDRIISSPFVRAYHSIAPLAEHLRLQVEIDNRLSERVLSAVPLEHWRERLLETFTDLDLSFDGGESSRTATNRGIAVVNEALQSTAQVTIFVTHGNLMTLILKHFDESIGFSDWENMGIPDVYLVVLSDGVRCMKRLRRLSRLSV